MGMSIRGGILAGLAVSAMALAAMPPASAATSTCGAACTTAAAERWGPGYVAAVALGRANTGQAVILSPAVQLAAEDFRLSYQGTVAEFYSAGIVGPAVGQTWPTEGVYEYEYAPEGTGTGYCVGTAVTAADGTPVSLQPCSVSAKTLWITLSADTIGGYLPLIAGSDTIIATPFVLTAGKPGQQLSVRQLYLAAGTLAPVQMWKNIAGVL